MRHSILLALGVCVASTPARAQTYEQDSLKDIMWVAANLGFGTAHLSCNGCPAPAGGMDFLLALGGVRNRHIRAALMWDEWESASSRTESLLLSVYYYPWAKQRFFLEGGFGGSLVCVRQGSADSTVSGSGVVFAGGLGFEVPLAPDKPGVLLKPRVGFTRIAGGDVARASVVSIGVGVQWER